MATDHYSSKYPIEIDSPVREFPRSPCRSNMSNSWTLTILSVLLWGRLFQRIKKEPHFLKTIRRKQKRKLNFKPVLSFSVWEPLTSLLQCAPNISAPCGSPELCFLLVLLAKVMPERQRDLSRESVREFRIGLWQGSTRVNKKQPDVVSPRWSCNNLGGRNFLGDWHNYTQTNCLNSHIFIYMRLKLASVIKPGEQQQTPKQREVLVTCLTSNIQGLIKSQPAVRASTLVLVYCNWGSQPPVANP